MTKDQEKEWFELMENVHSSIKGGMRYNTGKLLLVLYRPAAHENKIVEPTLSKINESRG